ncbi:ATP-binding protein [Pseudomonas oryzihabitans]|uniref:ATP-binding protein n=1 Tax=Pseudomonas oryzihabitans TaxID=47885 RepID=UPI001DBACA4A|nr:ATP-binding protein [Pseudomonas oryzihabitans]HJE70254.1 AAA family ATPase [Pseudomonas oryzihabitans]
MSQENDVLERITAAFRCAFPVVALKTFEVARARAAVKKVAADLGRHYHEMPFKLVPDPNQIKQIAEGPEAKRGVVIFDPYFQDRQRSSSENLPALKGSLGALEKYGVSYVIAGREGLSEEFVYHIDLPPMTRSEVIAVIKTAEQDVQRSLNGGRATGSDTEASIFTEEERGVVANHAMGLSHTQMRNVFILAANSRRNGKEYLSEIRREKHHILREVGLDVLEPVEIDTVGGLEPLKRFLRGRKVGWEKNLPLKGVLLAGVPGGGKTLMAKAAAGVFGTTLVRLDMNRFYSKYQGETEQRFRQALQTIEQIAPVTVLIDEIDKAFASGEADNEISRRLLGSFLYWLQERREQVFIVASANRVAALPPELMRAGRWDRCFFIDLPSADEREAILNIHLRIAQCEAKDLDLAALVRASDGYTGAEIEQAVTDARYLAAESDAAVGQALLLQALEDISPSSETRKADIDAIRRLGEDGFTRANTLDPIVEPYGGRALELG